MRVLVATDSIGELSSGAAGAAVGRQFVEAGCTVAVVPMGEAGVGFVAACAELWEVPLTRTGGVLSARSDGMVAAAPPGSGQPDAGFDAAASSAGLAAGWEPPGPGGTIYLDLAGNAAHDGGAGLLAALGATASVPLSEGVQALGGITSLDLAGARSVLNGSRLVGVVPLDEMDTPLLGLRGITSRREHAAGIDPALLLATDEALSRLAAEANRASGDSRDLLQHPDAGACGGAALAILALGGEVMTGPDAIAEMTGLPRTLAQADLVVTGCTQLDFGTSGGPVLRRVAELAEHHTSPVIAVAGQNYVSSRELRSMGIEQAYSLAPDAKPETLGAKEIGGGMEAVVRQWVW